MSKDTNWDRVLGMISLIFSISCGVVGIIYNHGWGIVITVFWSVMLILWCWSGVNLLPIGWRGQLKWMGGRIKTTFGEGIHWTPPPFGIIPVDCRRKTIDLDTIKIFTSDGVEIKIKELSIVWQVDDLDLYNNMDPSNLSTLLDEVIDVNVREKVHGIKFENVLGMSLGTNQIQTSQDLQDCGIKIIKIVVSEIEPANSQILKDIELRESKNLEREGQKIEAEHTVALVERYKKIGVSADTAADMALLETGKAEKKKIKKLVLGSEGDLASLINLLAPFFGSRGKS
jgi:hypothetical protein